MCKIFTSHTKLAGTPVAAPTIMPTMVAPTLIPKLGTNVTSFDYVDCNFFSVSKIDPPVQGVCYFDACLGIFIRVTLFALLVFDELYYYKSHYCRRLPVY